MESMVSPATDEDVEEIVDVFVGEPKAIDPEPGRFCEPYNTQEGSVGNKELGMFDLSKRFGLRSEDGNVNVSTGCFGHNMRP